VVVEVEEEVGVEVEGIRRDIVNNLFPCFRLAVQKHYLDLQGL